ncbi:hypothetical protein Lser_V15G14746 [Lactuca serriola]
MKESKVVDEFAVKLSNLVSTIRTLGDAVEESYVVKKLLRFVPSKFLHITSTLEQFGDLETMTVEEVIGRLKAHKERMRGHRESDERKLLLTHKEWSERNKKKTDGETKQKPNRGSVGNSRGRGREEFGYYAAECKNPRRERNQENNLIQDHHDNEPAFILSTFEHGEVFLNEENVTPQLRSQGNTFNQSSMWYLDTGASNHMTGDKCKFRNLNESIQGYVKFGNEAKVRIEGKGSIVVQCKDGSQRKHDELYYIPHLCSNIISM